MAISEIWLPRPADVGIGAKTTTWVAMEAHRVGEQLRRTLPFAWVPIAAGLALSIPATASLNGAAQWVVLGIVATTVVWVQLASLVAWSGSDRLVVGRDDHTTADVLRRLRKQGWSILADATVGGRRIDHVAVGPGGVLVIETKVRTDLTRDDLDWAAHQAQRHRREVLGLLGPAFDAAPIVPVVVTWTTGAGEPDQPTFVGGVRVVRGQHLADWLALFATQRLTADQVAEATARVAA